MKSAQNGYILECRKILDSAIWKKPPMYFKVWHYLLLKAQHKEYKGLQRGQLFTSIDEIRESCSYYVGYRKVTPSRKEIWGILEWLRNPNGGNSAGNNGGNSGGGMVVTTKVTHGIVVSVVKYGLYQTPENYESNSEIPTEATAEVTAKEQRKESQGNNNNKNDKNNKNNNKTPLPPFDEKATNVENLKSILNAKAHDETDYLKSNKILYSKLKDWCDYKDHLAPKSQNHYTTQRGLCTFISIAVRNAKEHGVERVCNVIDEAIASGWKGVVWENLLKRGRKKQSATDAIDAW